MFHFITRHFKKKPPILIQEAEILQQEITVEQSKEELIKHHSSELQKHCPHHYTHRRVVLDPIINPGHKEVICVQCGLIKVFETR